MDVRKWLRVLGLLVITLVAVQAGREIFREQEYQARQKVHEAVKTAFPDAARRLAGRYGLKSYWGNRYGLGETVILIHGLDDPGLIWRNLAPALKENGFRVLIMTYPNDQDIAASSRLFFDEMSRFFQPDQTPVSVVAHSMGGLVTRDMLTNPRFDYAGQVKKGRLPRVTRLIMVGTPNHGSELARFRFFTEIRDQFVHLGQKDVHWLHSLLDGTGAAEMDLLPGSRFLTELNRRSRPDDVRFHVIAGIMSPWTLDSIDSLMSGIGENLPAASAPAARSLEDFLVSMTKTLGDGLVPVDSARLDNVPLTLVNGTHLTMIRNLTRNSERIPPAVPVILDLLNR